MKTVKVSSKTPALKLSGLIANFMRTEDKIELISVGAGATNQAIKAIAIARGYLAPSGIKLAFSPSFKNIEVEDTELVSIKLVVSK